MNAVARSVLELLPVLESAAGPAAAGSPVGAGGEGFARTLAERLDGEAPRGNGGLGREPEEEASLALGTAIEAEPAPGPRATSSETGTASEVGAAVPEPAAPAAAVPAPFGPPPAPEQPGAAGSPDSSRTAPSLPDRVTAIRAALPAGAPGAADPVRADSAELAPRPPVPTAPEPHGAATGGSAPDRAPQAAGPVPSGGESADPRSPVAAGAVAARSPIPLPVAELAGREVSEAARGGDLRGGTADIGAGPVVGTPPRRSSAREPLAGAVHAAPPGPESRRAPAPIPHPAPPTGRPAAAHLAIAPPRPFAAPSGAPPQMGSSAHAAVPLRGAAGRPGPQAGGAPGSAPLVGEDEMAAPSPAPAEPVPVPDPAPVARAVIDLTAQGVASPAPGRATGPAAAASPALPESIPMHVEWLAARGGGRARLQLHPPELGAVEISVRVRGSRVEVIVSALEPAARTLVHHYRELLGEQLAARDLRMDHFEVRGLQRADASPGSGGGDAFARGGPEGEGRESGASSGQRDTGREGGLAPPEPDRAEPFEPARAVASGRVDLRV